MKGCGSFDGMASIPLLPGHSFVYVNVMKIKCTYIHVPKNVTEICVCVCVYTLKGSLGGGVGLKTES